MSPGGRHRTPPEASHGSNNGRHLMARTAWILTVALVLLGAGRATADPVVVYPPGYCPPPAVSYYAPAPVVTYYAAPRVSYYYAPAVSYYAPAPAVSYYAPPVSYYAAPGAVTTTRYGVFGRPRVSTTY